MPLRRSALRVCPSAKGHFCAYPTSVPESARGRVCGSYVHASGEGGTAGAGKDSRRGAAVLATAGSACGAGEGARRGSPQVSVSDLQARSRAAHCLPEDAARRHSTRFISFYFLWYFKCYEHLKIALKHSKHRNNFRDSAGGGGGADGPRRAPRAGEVHSLLPGAPAWAPTRSHFWDAAKASRNAWQSMAITTPNWPHRPT